jgi:hypothetical protein
VKLVYQHSDTATGIGFALIGGFTKYCLQIHNTPYMVNLAQAAVTALVCGVMGVLGKELVAFIKRRYFNKKS